MKNELSRAIQVLNKALQNPSRWYAGIEVKRYIKSKIFGSVDKFYNPTIDSGRWSAYCHYSQLIAFQNLIEKHHITSQSIVVIHPLLPIEYITYLESLQCTLLSLDIHKSTLTFEPQNLYNYLRQLKNSGKEVSLVINYSINGLYLPIVESLTKTQKLNLPTLIIVDNSFINRELVNVFESLTLGSIVFCGGDSFLDDQIKFVVDGIKLKSKPWFFSWYIETRTKSIPEYHLKESFSKYNPLVKSLLEFALNKQQSGGIWDRIITPLTKAVYLGNKKDRHTTSISIIAEEYESILGCAVPDIFFELDEVLGSPQQSILPVVNSEYSFFLQQTAKKLYDFFSNFISIHPDIGLEIPEFYIDKTYAQFPIYTSDKSYWMNYFHSLNIGTVEIIVTSPQLTDQPNLNNVTFVNSYGLLISVNDALHSNHFS